MPQKVTVPGVGEVNFPDGMSSDDMAHAIDDIVATSNRKTAAPAAPPSGGAIADAARAKLAAAGTTPAEVKGKAAAGENPDPKAPTTYERVASDVAATVGGTGQLLGGIVAGIPEQLYNIATAAPRSAHAAANVILSGGSLEDALQAAKNVQPHRELEDLAGRAGEDARTTIRDALGVRRSAIVPQEDIMQQVPAALAILQGAIKTPEMLAPRAAPSGAAEAATSDSSGVAAAPAGAAPQSGLAGSETLPEIDSRDFGPALRTLYTGERDVRAAEANVVADNIRKLVPDHVDREALTLARDFKADPQKMAAYLDPQHPAYAGLEDDARTAAHENMLKLQPVIERALDPTPEMKVADAALSSYFGRTLDEGRELGFLDSKTDPQAYINHLLLPKDAEEAVSVDRPAPSRMNRFTPNARERYYPTVLDAVANGVNPRTLDVADAVSIYGDKHGTAAATNILIDTLKKSDLGRFATDSTAPEGWAEVGPGTRVFRNEVPFVDEEGNPQVAHQALYAPKDVADALRPITDPDWISTVPGFRASRMYQAYIKSVELGLSVFHMRALNVTALNNEGLSGLIKTYGADLDSPQFLEAEKTFLRNGGTTSITGRTIEAYRAANPKSLPTTLDVIRGLPVVKQLDQIAGATSKLTFNVLQRKFKVVDFSIKNAKWIADNPNASPRELAAAQRSIAKEINSAYGGLNWEALGVNRATHSLAKAIFLAPDWTFSNWQTAKTAFEGSPGGTAARAFWLRSAITGMALTQATSMLLSGRKSDNPTMVYLGKDKAGKGIYQNMFFAGAPSDLVTLIGNVKDYGVFEGTALSVANKLAPFARASVHAFSNKNFLGQDIVPKGSGLVAGTGRAVLNLGSDVVPVPFSASNLVQMLTDRKRQYTPMEYLTTMLTGARSRHIKEDRQTQEKTRNSTWKIITGSPVYQGRGRR